MAFYTNAQCLSVFMIDHFKSYKLTYSGLLFLLVLAALQGVFNFNERPVVIGAEVTASSSQPSPPQGPEGILAGAH